MAQTTPNHTQTVSGWAAHDPSGKITLYTFKRRENGENDVTIKVLYCGICHTDLHHVKNDWGITTLLSRVGSKGGDRAGVGCLAATCLDCEYCEDAHENYCDQVQFVYNGIFWDGSITYGGYSEFLVADHRWMQQHRFYVRELLFSPLKDNNLLESSGKRIGVVGLGGLGHIAVKFGKAFGHHVTVISTSPSKEKEAKNGLGADDFILSTNVDQMQAKKRTLDFILDTVSAHHSLGPTLELLKGRGGEGSMIGSIKETQEMMDVCGKHNISCDIEVVRTSEINEALHRLAKNDVKYRFVIDIAGKSSNL
ncbi:UNVERIFIED_CONTAM: putative cinnamyl alcohol dehydrogenase 6 [Sesamum angustifolium]|uniref:Cinnamyl alcohol dehydrogenase 6 n=1 Tax=Sesamum angustifolium TaxID=2727405 RepID=A0AAW2L620_9LAMI